MFNSTLTWAKMINDCKQSLIDGHQVFLFPFAAVELAKRRLRFEHANWTKILTALISSSIESSGATEKDSTI
jgi:hypothetical protein